MEYSHKNSKSNNKSLFIFISILIFSIFLMFLIIYLFLYTDLPRKIFFPIHYYEKYSFTDKEISSISDAINIECNSIEMMSYFATRDGEFTIYISDFEKKDLYENYTKNSYSYDNIVYEDKDPDTIYDTICYFEEYNGQNVLVVRMPSYDDNLYKIVKKKSKHTIY
ncbi:MAG: hypothetical protein HDT22_07315 [Ruminococcus sp.]|nr:hypothetical protein [Ruminococcus sp.]